MCQYCGCQQPAAIDELTREHDAVVALIRDVTEQVAAGRIADVAATCRRISDLLGPHTVVEEEGLFPELESEFPDQIAALTREHRQVEHVLGEAASGVPADQSWPQRLQEVLLVLRQHTLKEQDGVFPAAVISLGADQWERVDAARASASSTPHPPRSSQESQHSNSRQHAGKELESRSSC